MCPALCLLCGPLSTSTLHYTEGISFPLRTLRVLVSWVSVLSFLSLHPLVKYLLSAHYTPGTVLDAGSVWWTRQRPCSPGVQILGGADQPWTTNTQIGKYQSMQVPWEIKQHNNMESDCRKHLWWSSRRRSLRREGFWGEACMPRKASQVKIGGKHISQPKHTPVDFPSDAFFNLVSFFHPR